MSAPVVLSIVIGILAIATTILSGRAIWRSASQTAWRQAAEGWQARAEERDVEVADQDRRIQTLEHELADLRVVAPPIRELVQTFEVVMREHEERAIERHMELQRQSEAVVVALKALADNLPLSARLPRQ